ncbi:MAG: type II secretion system F family protein [Acidimicrobiia bacterium]|jgi:tight adherence protein B
MSVVVGISLVPIIASAVIAVAVFGLAMTLLSMDHENRSELEKRLTGYAGVADATEVEREDHSSDSNLMQDMVSLTGRMAERMGVLNRVEGKLEQADLPLRPPEALFVYLTIIALTAVLSFVIFGPIGALVLTLAAIAVPVLYLEYRRKRRLRRFEMQLPDVLNLLSGSMRAGFSFAQGLEAVAEEASEPSRRELQRAYAESRLGRPIEDALEDSAARMHSIDLMWAVMAIRIQREVGGNLAELLDTVASTMTERERLRHEVLSLTAEGRMSAWVLGIFPPLFAVILFMIQPDYMKTLFENPMGVMAVVVSAVLAGFGFLWLRKIMAIEV